MNILGRFEEQKRILTEFLDAINAEIGEFNRLAKDCESPALKRMKCRVIFSCIESYVSHLKQSAIMFSIDQPDLFNPEELLALSDQESFVTNKGEVVTKPTKIRLKDNIRLAFYAFARSHGKDYPIDYGDTDAECFTASVKIRDRLNHPKKASDLVISDAEAEQIDRAWIWFTKHLATVAK